MLPPPDVNISVNNLMALDQLQNFSEWKKKVVSIREQFKFYAKVHIKWFDSVTELQQYVGVPIPPWVIGTTQKGSILIVNYELWRHKNLGTMEELITHEFIHLALQHKLKSPCPLWLNEGMAVYLSGQIGSLVSEDYESDSQDVYNLDYSNENFYVISGLAVKKLVDCYGLHTIINRLLLSGSFMYDSIFGEQPMNSLFEQNRLPGGFQ